MDRYQYAEAQTLLAGVIDQAGRAAPSARVALIETRALVALAAVHSRTTGGAQALPLLVRAVAGLGRLPPGRESVVLAAGANVDLARAQFSEGHGAEAASALARAIRLRDGVLPRDDLETVRFVGELAVYLEGQRRFADAEPHFIRVYETGERLLAERSGGDFGLAVAALGRFYVGRNRSADAERLYMRALAASERVLGRDHRQTVDLVGRIDGFYTGQGRYIEAEPFTVRYLQGRIAAEGAGGQDVLELSEGLAQMYRATGRDAEAEALLLQITAPSLRAPEGASLGEFGAIFLGSLADLYEAQERYPEAESLYRRICASRGAGDGEEDYVALSCGANIARLHEAQGRYADAEILRSTILQAARRAYLQGEFSRDLWYLVLEPLADLAELNRLMGRGAAAEALYLEGLAISRQRSQPAPSQADLSIGWAAALDWAQSRYGGDPVLGQFLRYDHDTSWREGAFLETLELRDRLGELYRDQERLAEAEAQFRAALDESQRALGGDHPITLVFVVRLASVYGAQGRADRAEPLYQRAIRLSERAFGGHQSFTLAVAAGLSRTLLASGPRAARAGTALAASRLLASGLRLSRDRTARSRQAGRTGEGPSDPYGGFSLLADAAWVSRQAGGDIDGLGREAFSALQEAMAGPAGRAIAQMAVRRRADSVGQGLGALVREREALTEARRATDVGFILTVASAAETDTTLRANLEAERRRIDRRLDEIDARLEGEFSDYFALTRPAPVSPQAAQALLGPDEAILLVVPTEFGTHVVGVSHTQILWVRSEWTRAEVDGAVGQLLGNIRLATAGERFVYDRGTAHNLYRQIVAPVASVLAGKRHLFIAAAGSLASIPFGILVTEAPQGADDDMAALRDTLWFADAHALIQIPSIQSLQFLRRPREGEPQPERPAAGFVGFGNPVLDGPADLDVRRRCGRGRGTADVTPAMIAAPGRSRAGGMVADVDAIRRLCPLTGTAVELENLRAALAARPDALFLAENSTEQRLRGMDLSRVAILAFATHGLLAGELQGAAEPGLVFTPPEVATEDNDGYLTASEVATLRLDADWVILSACNTAAGSSLGAPGLSGLARAFFYAGARNLLASHWLVVDEAAPRLTVRTIELMRERPAISRAQALQRAMREVRRDPARPAWSHPGVWAPFSLVGDGAR